MLLIGPLPIIYFGHILTVGRDVLAVFDELVADKLLHIRACPAEFRHPIDYISDQMKAIHIVAHDHIKRRGGRAFLFVSTHM